MSKYRARRHHSFNPGSKLKYLNSDQLLPLLLSEIGYSKSAPTNVNNSEMDYWQKGNVYKTKMKETMHVPILQHQILRLKKSINHDEYCYHVKQFILTSANSYCNFHILFMYYVLYFPLSNSYCNFHILFIYYVLHFPLGTSTLYFLCFSFFLIDCTWKQMLSIYVIYLCFVKDRSLVSWTDKMQQLKIKSNTPWVT